MMKKILPALIVAGLTFGGAAFAGTTATTAPAATATTATAPMKVSAPANVSGAIKKINAKHMYIVLDNGKRYHLPSGFDMSGLKVGEKVTVTYTMKGKLHEASAVKAS